MSDQNIYIMAKQRDPFARVAKTMLNDHEMSWRAKGALSYLLGKPAGWKMKMSDIVKHGPDGMDVVKSIFRELRNCGYAELTRVTKKGKVVEWVWKVSDSPIFKKTSLIVKRVRVKNQNPQVVSPQVVSPQVVNPPISKKDSSNRGEEGVPPKSAPLPDVAASAPPPKKLPTDAPGEARGIELNGEDRPSGPCEAESKRGRYRGATSAHEQPRDAQPAMGARKRERSDEFGPSNGRETMFPPAP